MKEIILAISGKPGLFQLVSRGRATLVVETVDEQKRRTSVSLRDRISSLNDISIYTDDEDVKLMQVFENIREKYEGKPVAIDARKASKEELSDFLAEVLPNYDRTRVYPNDIKKMILARMIERITVDRDYNVEIHFFVTVEDFDGKIASAS